MLSPVSTAPVPGELVGLGCLSVSNRPRALLVSGPLGAGLGVTIWDPVVRVGGLLHALLPDSGLDPTRAASQPALFVDTGLAELLRAAQRLRAEPARLRVCVAGAGDLLEAPACFAVGRKNYEAFRRALDRHGLEPCAERVGGLANLSLSLELPWGTVCVQASACKEAHLLWTS